MLNASATVVLVVEGVLRMSVGDGVIPQGARLYHGLKEMYKVALVTNEVDLEEVTHWLRVNGFHDHPYLLPGDPLDIDDDAIRRVHQINRLRFGGNNVDLVIEPDPHVGAVLVNNGIPVMVYISPRYSRPEFRPDHDGDPTPWSELIDEVARQEQLRSTDVRAEMT